MNEAPFLKRKSPIQGFGLFANRNFLPGTVLFKAIVVKNSECFVEELAKWVNHCRYPNTILHRESDGWYLVAIAPIQKGEEIVANYNATPACIYKPNPEWDLPQNAQN